jgi:hypothetical protein
MGFSKVELVGVIDAPHICDGRCGALEAWREFTDGGEYSFAVTRSSADSSVI